MKTDSQVQTNSAQRALHRLQEECDRYKAALRSVHAQTQDQWNSASDCVDAVALIAFKALYPAGCEIER